MDTTNKTLRDIRKLLQTIVDGKDDEKPDEDEDEEPFFKPNTIKFIRTTDQEYYMINQNPPPLPVMKAFTNYGVTQTDIRELSITDDIIKEGTPITLDQDGYYDISDLDLNTIYILQGMSGKIVGYNPDGTPNLLDLTGQFQRKTNPNYPHSNLIYIIH